MEITASDHLRPCGTKHSLPPDTSRVFLFLHLRRTSQKLLVHLLPTATRWASETSAQSPRRGGKRGLSDHQLGPAMLSNSACRDVDQVKADLISSRHLSQFKDTKAAEDLPGLGRNYCVECAKWFDTEKTLTAHQRGKPHKRRYVFLPLLLCPKWSS